MSEQAASNAGEVKQPVNSNVVTESEFLATRISQMEAKANPPEPEPEKPAEEPTQEAEKSDGNQEQVAAEVDTEDTKAEGEQEEAKVLSKIDFEQLSEAEIQELATKARSKALARFGELTADKRALQQQLAQLQAELSKHQKPALETAPQIPKEYAQIDKVETLQEKAAEAKSTMEWAETQLDNAEHLAATDAIETEYGTFTKAKLKELYRTARKAKDEWIPAQFNELQASQQRAALREAYTQKMKQELKWLEGEDNEVRKEYEALVKSPLIDKIRKAVPEAEPYVEHLIGHAVNSYAGRKYHALTEETPAKAVANGKVAITPPSQVKNSAASRGDEVLGKQVNELAKKFDSTRSENDFLALRTAQRLKRAK